MSEKLRDAAARRRDNRDAIGPAPSGWQSMPEITQRDIARQRAQIPRPSEEEQEELLGRAMDFSTPMAVGAPAIAAQVAWHGTPHAWEAAKSLGRGLKQGWRRLWEVDPPAVTNMVAERPEDMRKLWAERPTRDIDQPLRYVDVPETTDIRSSRVHQNLYPHGETFDLGPPHAFDVRTIDPRSAPMSDARGLTFDPERINSGEGAQSYGWGGYATRNPELADGYYRDRLARNQWSFAYGDRDRAFDTARKRAQEMYDRRTQLGNWGLSEAMEKPEWETLLQHLSNPSDKWDAAGLFRRLEDLRIPTQDIVQRQAGGRLYKVDVPEDAELLQWAGTLDDQPPDVLSALRRARDFLPAEKGKTVRPNYGMEPPVYLPNWKEALDDPMGAGLGKTGEDLYREISRAAQSDVADQVYGFRSRSDADRLVSEGLRKAGIPGHAYDGRSSGEQNFVVYAPERFRILDAFQDLGDATRRDDPDLSLWRWAREGRR